MEKATETYEEMLRRAYKASPGTCGAIVERAAYVFKKSVRDVCADYKATFGCYAGS